MELYTVQMARWRKVDSSILFLDVTVKSGDKTFAPTWALLREYKTGGDEKSYTKTYKELMSTSLKNNPVRWREICDTKKVAFACYCKKGSFCHRYILVKMFEQLCKRNNIPFTYAGEIT